MYSRCTDFRFPFPDCSTFYRNGQVYLKLNCKFFSKVKPAYLYTNIDRLKYSAAEKVIRDRKAKVANDFQKWEISPIFSVRIALMPATAQFSISFGKAIAKFKKKSIKMKKDEEKEKIILEQFLYCSDERIN